MKSVHVYPSTFEYETRMLKVTRAQIARTAISEVIVIAQSAPQLPDREQIDDHREVRRIGTRLKGTQFWAKALRFGEWSLKVIAGLRREKIDVVNCHSLSVLPLCAVLARLHRAILVYEPHELETETETFTGRRQRLAKRLERFLIRRVDRVIVVSEGIADQYQADYGLPERPDVILNVPPLDSANPRPNRRLRDLYDIPDEALVFMYQGVLDPARGCAMLLEVFAAVPPGCHIVFLGFGPMQDEIAAAADERANVHFHPAVPPGEIMEYTLGADIGFALLEDSCLNHALALPNKLFHYLHAGLPVIVSDLPEMGGLVDRWTCGWRSANGAWALAEAVTRITPETRTAAAVGAVASRKALNWQAEEEKLTVIYEQVLGPATKRTVMR